MQIERSASVAVKRCGSNDPRRASLAPPALVLRAVEHQRTLTQHRGELLDQLSLADFGFRRLQNRPEEIGVVDQQDRAWAEIQRLKSQRRGISARQQKLQRITPECSNVR